MSPTLHQKLYLVALTALALSSENRAFAEPLFAGLAAKYDQAITGCPAIGSGEALPQPDLCAGLKKPEDYCSVFKITPTVQSDPTSQKAAETCLTFYRNAVAAEQLFCDYQKDSLQLKQSINAKVQAINGASDAEKFTKNAWGCAIKSYGYYQQAAMAMMGDLGRAYANSERDLLALTDEGSTNLTTEVHCQKNGVPGKVPAFLEVGVSAHSLEGQKETKELLLMALNKFSFALGDLIKQGRATMAAAASNQNQLGSLVNASQIPAPKPTSDITGLPENGTETKATPQASAKTASTRAAGDTAWEIGANSLDKPESTLKELFKDVLTAAKNQGLEATLHSAKNDFIISIGATYWEKGKVNQEDVIQQLYLTGATAAMGLAATPAITTIAVTAGVTLFLSEVHRFWESYVAQTILKPYVEFAQQEARGNSGLTSQQIATDFAPRKAKAWYCQDCPATSGRAGCQQKSMYISKFNKYGDPGPLHVPTR